MADTQEDKTLQISTEVIVPYLTQTKAAYDKGILTKTEYSRVNDRTKALLAAITAGNSDLSAEIKVATQTLEDMLNSKGVPAEKIKDDFKAHLSSSAPEAFRWIYGDQVPAYAPAAPSATARAPSPRARTPAARKPGMLYRRIGGENDMTEFADADFLAHTEKYIRLPKPLTQKALDEAIETHRVSVYDEACREYVARSRTPTRMERVKRAFIAIVPYVIGAGIVGGVAGYALKHCPDGVLPPAKPAVTQPVTPAQPKKRRQAVAPVAPVHNPVHKKKKDTTPAPSGDDDAAPPASTGDVQKNPFKN